MEAPSKKTIAELIGLAFAMTFLVVVIVYGNSYVTSPRVIEINNETVTTASPTTSLAMNEIVIPTPIEEVITKAPVIEYKQEKVTVADTAKLPSANTFATFTYSPVTGKVVHLSGTCTGDFFDVLVFSAKDDYKKNPAAAKVNTAFTCPATGKVSADINLADFNLPAGEYYVFIADLDKTGAWYNPR
jgi:hypothetical protein